MGLASVCSKAMVLLLLIHWLFVLLLFEVGGCCDWSLLCMFSGLLLLQSSGLERIASCFTLIVFLLMLFLVFGALPHGFVG